MEDHSKDNQPDFIREKIVRKTDMRKELLKVLGKPAVSGAVFGLTAALIFILCISFFHPSPQDGEKTAQTEETAAQTQTQAEDVMPGNKEELENFISQIVKDETSQEESVFYNRIRKTVQSLGDYMVTVVAVKKDVDWFAMSYDSQYAQSGILIRKTEDRYYILTGYRSLRNAASIRIKFSGGTSEEALLEGYDTVFDIAVLSISRKDLPASEDNHLKTVKIGTSSMMSAGIPVFVSGCPSGTEGSVGIGFISFVEDNLPLTDCLIRGIQSSVRIEGTGCSFLMGIDGDLLGIYTGENQNVGDGYSQAYSINDVMVYINRILGGRETAGIGITGQDIDETMRTQYQIPQGIYVTDVIKDSAAHNAGVQAGDVLEALNGQKIASMEEYEQILMELTPGREVKMTVYRSSQGAYKKVELKITPTVRQG